MSGKEGRQLKKCPFLKEWCIGEDCAIHVYITVPTREGPKRRLCCGFEASMIMLSELNQKTPMPQRPNEPNLILPFMGRG